MLVADRKALASLVFTPWAPPDGTWGGRCGSSGTVTTAWLPRAGEQRPDLVYVMLDDGGPLSNLG
jgi:hypothetical protein